MHKGILETSFYPLPLSQQAAHPCNAPPLLFVTNLPDVKPVANFILREEFHRRPSLWPHPVAQWGSCKHQMVTFLLGRSQLTALGTAPFLLGLDPGLGVASELADHEALLTA